MKNNFTKSDLKNWDIMLRRNKDIDIVCLDLKYTICNNGYMNSLSDLADDLTEPNSIEFVRPYDVVQVRRLKKIK